MRLKEPLFGLRIARMPNVIHIAISLCCLITLITLREKISKGKQSRSHESLDQIDQKETSSENSNYKKYHIDHGYENQLFFFMS